MGLRIAVAGATGAVGREMMRLVESSGLAIDELRPLASARSAGTRLTFRGAEVEVRELRPDSFEGIDYALFSAGAARSREFAPPAVAAGAVVIDNSSAFRMNPDVPLVVPEVNAEAARAHKGIIANPNCSTIQLVLPLKVLSDAPGLERVVVSTYQSASGAGQSGIDELLAGSRAYLAGEAEPAPATFAHPLAFEALPHIGSFQPSGYTDEELKLTNETRKIMSLPGLDISATCVRVPVTRGHSESVTVDLAGPCDLDEVRARMSALPNLVVRDEPSRNIYPLARVANGQTDTYVGRLRRDVNRSQTLHFWVVSDNLLKGAAFNAVQILTSLVEA
jgi:aspartate-semialdehyde dehydrogenase